MAEPVNIPAEDLAWRRAIIAEARGWLGVPYLHQASDPRAGCDCVGLVRGVWRALCGPEPEMMLDYSPDWSEARGLETVLEAASNHLQTVAHGKALPGDVLVFRWRPHLPAKHCGILVTPTRMVHAYQVAGKVTESDVSHWSKRIAGVFAFPRPEGTR